MLLLLGGGLQSMEQDNDDKNGQQVYTAARLVLAMSCLAYYSTSTIACLPYHVYHAILCLPCRVYQSIA